LVATSVLEEGIDMPRCNLVVRFEPPQASPLAYRSYVHSKGRARAPLSNFVMLIEEEMCSEFISQLAELREIEKVGKDPNNQVQELKRKFIAAC